MILIFFLQYLNYFGEVILSPLIYFIMKKKFGERNNQNKKSSFHYLIKFKYENREIPNSLRGSLSCLGFRGLRNENAIKYDMQE